MSKPTLIKNISFTEPHVLVDLVDYEKGRVVSRTLAQTWLYKLNGLIQVRSSLWT